MKIILIGILSCFTFFNVLGCSSGSSSDNPQPVITKIVIDTDGVKNNYFQSERLNLKNLKVVAVYSDNSSMPVTDYTTIPENNSSFDSAGEIDVLISYADFTKSFRINVEPISVTGISINSDNVKKNYHISESLDLTGLIVKKNCNDGNSIIVSDYSSNPSDSSNFDSSGDKKITVSYAGFSETFIIHVAKSVISATSPVYSHSDDNFLTYSDGTFTASSGYVSYTWFLDEKMERVHSQTYTPISVNPDLKTGHHTVMAVVKNEKGEVYSSSYEFTIKD